MMPAGRIDRRAREREHDHLLERVLVGELAVERQQDVVDDQEAVLGVGGDPADLVRRQAQVQRVHHAAGGRNAEVALEVGVVVPAQRRDAIALLQAERAQRRRRARACAGGTRRSCACAATCPAGARRSAAAEQRAGAVQQVVERQRHVHHRRLHAGLLRVCRPVSAALLALARLDERRGARARASTSRSASRSRRRCARFRAGALPRRSLRCDRAPARACSRS